MGKDSLFSFKACDIYIWYATYNYLKSKQIRYFQGF